MGNREMKDPLIFKDFKEWKVFHNYTPNLVRINTMVLNSNITPILREGVAVTAGVIEV